MLPNKNTQYCLSTIRSPPSPRVFGSAARPAYIVSLLAALVTSLLRLRQRLPRPQLSREWGASLVCEDASHYVIYALMFVVPPPVTLVLLPVTLFSVLHSSSYTLQLLDVSTRRWRRQGMGHAERGTSETKGS